MKKNYGRYFVLGFLVLLLSFLIVFPFFNPNSKYNQDKASVEEANKAIEFIEGYYDENLIYPSQVEFYENFDFNLTYSYYNLWGGYISEQTIGDTNTNHFVLEYPVNKKRNFAFGRYRSASWVIDKGYYTTSCQTRRLCLKGESRIYDGTNGNKTIVEDMFGFWPNR